MKKFFTCLSFLLFTLAASAQTYNGGVWYSLFQNQEFNQGSIGTLTKEFDVFPPTASSMSFQWKNKKFWFNGTFGSVDLNFYESTDGSSYGEGQQVVNCGVGTDKTSYQKDSYTIINPSQLRKFKFTLGTSYGAWVSYLTLPLAKHILLSGGDYGKTSVSKTFTQATRIGESTNIRADFRSFLTAGNISISLSEGDAEVFRLGSADNTSGVLTTSTAGKTYAVGSNACASANGTAAACANGQLGKIGNYSFQIYFCPKAEGEANGKITITDGTSTATISLTGTGLKMETLEVPVNLSLCKGSSVKFHGKTYTQGVTADHIEAIGAVRDTLYVVNVAEKLPSYTAAEMQIYVGDDEVWNGIALKDSTVGVHTVVYTTENAVGCDSIVTLTLTVLERPTTYGVYEASICEGGSVEYAGKTYTQSVQEDVLLEMKNVYGGDSIVHVAITVNPLSYTAAEMEITVGDEVEWNGIALKDSTVGVHTVVYTTTNAVGCDSIVTLTLTVNKLAPVEVNYPIGFCTGDSAEYRGKWYFEYALDTIYAEGDVRDTIIYVEVMLLPTTDLIVLYDTIVSGNEVILPEGEWVIGEDTVSGTYPTVESEDASELIFHQYFDEPVVCGPNYIELIVTVTPKEQKPGDTTTDIEDVLDAQKAEKVLIDGVLYIRRNDALYTTEGRRVE